MFDSPTKPSETPKKTKIEQCLSVSEPYLHSDPKLWWMLVTLLTRMNEMTTFETPSTLYQYVAEVGPGIKGFQWHSIFPGVSLSEMNFRSFPSRNMKSFYVWENLGHGMSGRAFLASSKSIDSPVMGVIKCFFSKTKGDEKRKKKEQLEARDGEAKVWRQVYPDYQIHEVVIFEDQPALLMQYFSSIDPEKRQGLVQLVQKTLERNYDVNNLVHEDVQWRNIGQDQSGNVVVYDMGQVIEKEVMHEGWVQKAIEKLKGCDKGEGK